MREIELFVPYRFDKRPIYVNYINRMFDHEAIYVSKGRYANIILYVYQCGRDTSKKRVYSCLLRRGYSGYERRFNKCGAGN